MLSEEKKDILLVFPPLGNHEHPHMGLPVIKGYLLNKGYNSCKIKDYNAIIMKRMFEQIMKNNELDLWEGKNENIYQNYLDAKKIMKGTTDSDKLKSGIAMKIISKYLRIVGAYLRNYSFDPTSFYAIETEVLKTNLAETENLILSFIRDEVIPDILKSSPQIVGFSIPFASQIYYTSLICRELRKAAPELKIILGGAQASLFYKAFLGNATLRPLFDVIIREQGEQPFISIIDAWIYHKHPLSKVPNLAYWDEEKGIVTTELIPSINMDEVSTPDYSDMLMDNYAYSKLPYMLSRGCYWGKCKFCGYRGEKTRYIKSDIQKVINDFKRMNEAYGIRIFHLMDDAISPEYLSEVAKAIIKEKLDICYAAFLRAEKGFTYETCKLLYQSGLREVLFGFETANERVLNAMDKGNDLNTTKSVLQNFKKAGIMSDLSCIIGFPTETKEEAMDTINFLENNRDIYHKAYITPFRLMSDMIYNPEEHSIYDIDINNPIRHDINGYISLEYSFRSTKGMTSFEYMDMVTKGRKVTETAPYGPIYFR